MSDADAFDFIKNYLIPGVDPSSKTKDTVKYKSVREFIDGYIQKAKENNKKFKHPRDWTEGMIGEIREQGRKQKRRIPKDLRLPKNLHRTIIALGFAIGILSQATQGAAQTLGDKEAAEALKKAMEALINGDYYAADRYFGTGAPEFNRSGTFLGALEDMVLRGEISEKLYFVLRARYEKDWQALLDYLRSLDDRDQNPPNAPPANGGPGDFIPIIPVDPFIPKPKNNLGKDLWETLFSNPEEIIKEWEKQAIPIYFPPR